MVASISTIDLVRDIVLKHVEQNTAEALIADLEKVPGNASFKETIKLLSKAIHRDNLDKSSKQQLNFSRISTGNKY